MVFITCITFLRKMNSALELTCKSVNHGHALFDLSLNVLLISVYYLLNLGKFNKTMLLYASHCNCNWDIIGIFTIVTETYLY